MNHNGKERGDEPKEQVPHLLIINARFPLGLLVITAHAHGALATEDIQRGVQRHAAGDWGDVCEEDWAENVRSLEEGNRLLSAYDASNGTRFWVITEWDRSVTTVLLPQDY